MKIHCRYDALVDANSLIPNPKNRNIHPKEQVERLSKMLNDQGIRAPIVISKLSGCIVKGHGTLLAIKHLNVKDAALEIPVVYQDFEDSDAEYRFVQGDNAIASWASLDLSAINADLASLGPFDLDLLGIKDFQLEPDPKEGLCDEDEVPETKTTTDIKLGDVFMLGQHKIICGDSTDKATVERLMSYYKCDCGYINHV